MSATLLVQATPAHAAVQDEIQVYTDEIAKKGEPGLEIHTNYTPDGVKTPSYPGEVITNHGVRVTPEFSYGLRSDLEVGAYLPLMQLDGDGNFHLVGAKLRLKYLPFQVPEGGSGWYGGANTELSYVGHKFSQSRWQTELRPIIGYKTSEWHFAFNPILDWDLSDGFQDWDPTFVPSARLMREVGKGLAVGVEYYSDMGKLGHLLPWNEQDNRVYAVLDVDMAPWVFSLGVGRGLTEASDRWTLKATFEVPLQKKDK